MTELLIIADDLTGAIEAGVQMSRQKVRAEVIPFPEKITESFLTGSPATVTVINTESRHLEPAAAASVIRLLLERAGDSGVKWYYKKTDSTLRGNIGAELEAFMQGTGRQILPFVPAHPRVKRFTRKGYQYIGDTLLHRTTFADDPLEPVKTSYVPEILQGQANFEVRLSDLSENPQFQSDSGKRVIVVSDCSTVSDLRLIGKNIMRNGWQKAMAGTAGFAEMLPEMLGLKTSVTESSTPSTPMLLVNGSLNLISLEQVRYARENGVATVKMPLELLSSNEFENNSGYMEIKDPILEELKGGRSIIIHTSDTGSPYAAGESFRLVAGLTGGLVSSIMDKFPIPTLCVFGGDTLSGILQHLDCRSIEPVNELLPGVALSSLKLKSGKLHLISKPGGYGEKYIIMKILNKLKHK